MSASLQTQRRSFLLFLIGLLVLLLYILEPFLMSIIFGIVLVILFYPLYQFVLKCCWNKRYVASTLTTLLMLFFIALPATLIGALVTKQLSSVVDEKVVPFIEKGEITEQLKRLNVNIQSSLEKIEAEYGVQLNLKSLVANATKQGAQYVSKYSPMVLIQTLGFFLQGFIALIVVFFLFAEGNGLYNELLKLLPLKTSHETAIAEQMQSMIHAVFYGSFTTALIQGLLAGLIFYILKIEGFLVWGSLTFLFSFIPLLGAGAVWVPAAVILFISGQNWQALTLALYGFFIISMADNILKPLLMRGKNKLHPVLLFFAILGGINLVGPLGIILGPMTLAVFVASVRIYKEDYWMAEESEIVSVSEK